jgi:hypothetical protein
MDLPEISSICCQLHLALNELSSLDIDNSFAGLVRGNASLSKVMPATRVFLRRAVEASSIFAGAHSETQIKSDRGGEGS